MLFNSYIFICIFLPVVLVGWYGLNHFKLYRLAGLFLTGMSLWFYAYFNLSYLWIIISSIAVNYLISFFIKIIFEKKATAGGDSDGENSAPVKHEKILRRVILIVSVCINLGILFYFKYFDFFIENVNAVTGSNFSLKGIALPLGISFFTFQQLSFIIDRSLGRAEHYNLIDYTTFVTFFPQLIAGPIVLYDEMMPQFLDTEKRKFMPENFEPGIRLFVIGLAKKVLLADVLANPVNYGFAISQDLDMAGAIAVMLLYTFEIYFDFSGYCDMALGLGRMFNIELPVNFDSPYKSTSVKELWQRWHITLSRFFITYVYIPLGGSRRGYVRTLVNIMVVFTLSGLWHGAAWTYVVWGVMNGLLVVWDNLCIIGVKGQKYRRDCRLYMPKWLGWILTFGFFVLSLCFFRSSNIPEALDMIGHMFSFTWNGKVFDVAYKLQMSEFFILDEAVGLVSSTGVYYLHLVLMILMLALCFFIISRKNSLEIAERQDKPGKTAFLLAVLFVWCFISLSQVSTFLYFNF